MGARESSLPDNSPMKNGPTSRKENLGDFGDPNPGRSSTISVERLVSEDFEAPEPIIPPMFLPTKNIKRNWQFWTLRSQSLQKAYSNHCSVFNFEFYTKLGFGELLFKRVSDTDAQFDTSVFFKLIIVEKVEPIFSIGPASRANATQKHRLVIKGKTFQTAEYAKDPSKLKQVKLVAENELAKVCEVLVAEGDMLCVFGDISIDGADTVFLNNRFQHPVQVAHVKFQEDFKELNDREEWYQTMRTVVRDNMLVHEFISGVGEQAYHCQPFPDLLETDTSVVDPGGKCVLEESGNLMNEPYEEQLGSVVTKVSRTNVARVPSKTTVRKPPEPEHSSMEINDVDSPPEIVFDPNLDGEFDKRLERYQEVGEKENLPRLRARFDGNYQDSSSDESTLRVKRHKKTRGAVKKPEEVEEITLSGEEPREDEDVRTGKSRQNRNSSDSDSSEATIIVSPRSRSAPVTVEPPGERNQEETEPKENVKRTKKPKRKPEDDESSSIDKENDSSSKLHKLNVTATTTTAKPSSKGSAKKSFKNIERLDDSDNKSTGSSLDRYYERVVRQASLISEEPSKKSLRSSVAPVIQNDSRSNAPIATEVDVYTLSSDTESKSSRDIRRKIKKKPLPLDDSESESEPAMQMPLEYKRKPMPAKIRKYLKSLEHQKPVVRNCPSFDLGGRSTFKLKELPYLPPVSVVLNVLPEDVDEYLHSQLSQ